MKREFMKGNDAIVRGALLAGCSQYFGYPITPSSEVVHSCAAIFPLVGASFVQAESEVAAINMVYGAASAGKRVMTASSSPGISLKQEGVSYLACAELPCVIVDIMRAWPGLGNIWPEQSDYNQVVKGGGHGNYKCPVLAPNCPQEMSDLTIKAFELAEKYRTPVYLLADAYIGQVMEPVEFPSEVIIPKRQDWAIYGDTASKKNLVSSIKMDTIELEAINVKLQNKYKEMEENEVLYDEFMIEGAEMVVMAYGISARLAYSAVETLRAEGFKIGLLRPITLFPFPKKRIAELTKTAKVFTSVELSNGQMVDDVRLAVKEKAKVEFYGRMGGHVPEQSEVNRELKAIYNKHLG